MIRESAPAEFELIVHIGTGKTGSSSIQGTLRDNQERLREQQTAYLGLMGEGSPVKRFPWQKASGWPELLRAGRRRAAVQLEEMLSEAIGAWRSEGLSRAIWSNESMFVQGKLIVPILTALKRQRIAIRVIVYIRRHDAWARSAYLQWGLKHKTYHGPIRPFAEWRRDWQLKFYPSLKVWLSEEWSDMAVRNFDACGDVVVDFLEYYRLLTPQFAIARVNETPNPVALALWALFNNQFYEPILPIQLQRMLEQAGLLVNQPGGCDLAEMLPSEEDLLSVKGDVEEDRERLNKVLARFGQSEIDTSALTHKDFCVTQGQINTSFLLLLKRQFDEVAQLRRRVDELSGSAGQPEEAGDPSNRQPASRSETSNAEIMNVQKRGDLEEPVFVMSTAHAGSDLVQRLLNCHPHLVLWGEHGGFLNGLGKAYAQMRRQERFPKVDSENAGPALLLPTLQDPNAAIEWANPISLAGFEERLRGFVCDYFGSRLRGDMRWGFREVLYNNMAVLNLLRVLFPGGKFVFLLRDVAEVVRNRLYASEAMEEWSFSEREEREVQVKKILREIGDHYRVYRQFLAKNPDSSLLVHYGELVASPNGLTKMILEHLDLDQAPYDWDLAQTAISGQVAMVKQDEKLMAFIHEIQSALEERPT